MSEKLNCVTAFGFAAIFVMASAHAESLDERVEMTEGNLELLEESIDDLRNELESQLRVSGYVDIEYIMSKDDDSRFRMHHMSFFFQKKISDKWKFFSEIEFKDAPLFKSGTSEGKIFVEAVNLDYT